MRSLYFMHLCNLEMLHFKSIERIVKSPVLRITSQLLMPIDTAMSFWWLMSSTESGLQEVLWFYEMVNISW